MKLETFEISEVIIYKKVDLNQIFAMQIIKWVLYQNMDLYYTEKAKYQIRVDLVESDPTLYVCWSSKITKKNRNVKLHLI